MANTSTSSQDIAALCENCLGTYSPAAHAVVSSAVASTDDNSELRDVGARDGSDHLRAILGDAAALRLGADHVAGDVDEEEERHAALRAELDEVRRLERRLREQDPVVRHDPDRVAVDVREALRVVSVRAVS